MKAGGENHRAGWCDGNPTSEYGCSNPATFVARNEDTDDERRTIHACGKHLAAQIAAYPIPSPSSTRFLVVPFNPNVELLEEPS